MPLSNRNKPLYPADVWAAINAGLDAQPKLKSNCDASQLQLMAWTDDPARLPGSPTPSAGAVYFQRVYVDVAGITPGNIYMSVVTAGVTVANAFAGVYDPVSGNLLGSSADMSAAMQTVQPVKSALTASSPGSLSGLTLNQELYLAFVIGSAGTMPIICGGRTNGANLGMTSDYRTQVSTGSRTALPATIPGSLTLPSSMAQPFLAIGK